MYALVSAYMRAGKIDDAETFLNEIIAANPKNAEAHALIGQIRMLQKKPEEAEAAFKLAIERGPDRAIGYVALGRYYLTQGKRDLAKATFTEGRKSLPRNFVLGLSLAGMHEGDRDYESSIKIYEELLRVYPGALVLVNNLATLLVDQRTDEESLDRAGKLGQRLQASNVPQFRDTLGWIAYRRGQYRAALTYLNEAVDKLPKHNIVRYHLAMTYSALKRSVSAKEEFDRALELTKDDDPLKEKIKAGIEALTAE